MHKPPTPEDKTVNAAMTFIIDNYEPAKDYATASVRMSTQEIFDKLILQFPSPELTAQLIIDWLSELGFIYKDSGNMRAEWLLNKI